MTLPLLITIADADSYLVPESMYPLWPPLTDDEKNYHIDAASTYVRFRWECPNIKWDDPSTLTDDVKKAIALYSYKNVEGKLYFTDIPTGKGGIILERNKAGSLESEIWYDKATPRSNYIHLKIIDEYMIESGCTLIGDSSSLRRV